MKSSEPFRNFEKSRSFVPFGRLDFLEAGTRLGREFGRLDRLKVRAGLQLHLAAKVEELALLILRLDETSLT